MRDNAKYRLLPLSYDVIETCVDLFINTFSSEPWNDVYESREQVYNLFVNHMENNYFIGYILMDNTDVIALSIGMKKPWINGFEYYIDQFCVKVDMQGKGIGSLFLKLIEEDINLKEMTAIMLNTEKGFPSESFYIKNSFETLKELVILAK